LRGGNELYITPSKLLACGSTEHMCTALISTQNYSAHRGLELRPCG